MKFTLIIIVLGFGNGTGAAIEAVPMQTMELCQAAASQFAAQRDHTEAYCVQVRA